MEGGSVRVGMITLTRVGAIIVVRTGAAVTGTRAIVVLPGAGDTRASGVEVLGVSASWRVTVGLIDDVVAEGEA